MPECENCESNVSKGWKRVFGLKACPNCEDVPRAGSGAVAAGTRRRSQTGGCQYPL